MAERFTVPRICAYKNCGQSFIGRDKAGVKARYCSRACHFKNENNAVQSGMAGKIGGAVMAAKTRGTGTKGYIKEGGKHQHRKVMEQHIGRKLRSDEIIHHIDENKHNNDLKNLKIVTRSEHAKIHLTKTVATSS